MNKTTEIDEIVSELNTIPDTWSDWSPENILETLSILKNESLRNGNDNDAKMIWCLETATKIHGAYIKSFREMKRKAFYDAWCILERVEIELNSLLPHWDIIKTPINLPFIEEHTRRFQGLYPYAIFFSPEFVEHEIKCSICDKVVKPRKPCGHKVGEIYKGEMCYRVVTKAEFLSISAVKNPVQKYSVAFLTDEESGKSYDHHDYSLIRFVSDRLRSPFNEWSYIWEKILHPHDRFANVKPDEECPCESGAKYSDCCLKREGVVRPHCQIVFSVAPPTGLSAFEYSGK